MAINIYLYNMYVIIYTIGIKIKATVYSLLRIAIIKS